MTLPTQSEARAQLQRLADEATAHGGPVETTVELAPGDANYWTLNKAAKDFGGKVRTVRNLRDRKITLIAKP